MLPVQPGGRRCTKWSVWPQADECCLGSQLVGEAQRDPIDCRRVNAACAASWLEMRWVVRSTAGEWMWPVQPVGRRCAVGCSYSFRWWAMNAYSFLVRSGMLFVTWRGRLLFSATAGLPDVQLVKQAELVGVVRWTTTSWLGDDVNWHRLQSLVTCLCSKLLLGSMKGILYWAKRGGRAAVWKGMFLAMWGVPTQFVYLLCEGD